MEIPRYKIEIIRVPTTGNFIYERMELRKDVEGNICYFGDVEKLVEENKKLEKQLETINKLELGW